MKTVIPWNTGEPPEELHDVFLPVTVKGRDHPEWAFYSLRHKAWVAIIRGAGTYVDVIAWSYPIAPYDPNAVVAQEREPVTAECAGASPAHGIQNKWIKAYLDQMSIRSEAIERCNRLEKIAYHRAKPTGKLRKATTSDIKEGALLWCYTGVPNHYAYVIVAEVGGYGRFVGLDGCVYDLDKYFFVEKKVK